MYDELVKRLRHSANFAEHGLTPPPSELCAAADAIEELTALSRRQELELVELTGELASKPRWIPVSERLPEARDHVLVYAGFFQPFNEVSYIDAEGKWRFAYDDTEVPIVTHWQPLPEPPEEGKPHGN